jgi:hypothetical protein
LPLAEKLEVIFLFKRLPAEDSNLEPSG